MTAYEIISIFIGILALLMSFGNVFDKDGTIINLSEDEKKHIFVFDEEFVDANVKLICNDLLSSTN